MNILNNIALAYAVIQEEVEPLLFLARDKGLQLQALTKAQAFVERTDQERLATILVQDERTANQLLGLGLVGRALAAELEMYLLLKDEQSEGAWIKLIDAQDMVSAAARASSDLTNLDAKFERLRAMEGWFFPPQAFMSVGMVVREQLCSICQADYELCDHVAGRPYMGRFCNIVLKQVSADHIAYVETPYDRRCRVTSFSVPGGTRNRMTWVVTPKQEGEQGNATAIIAMADEE